MCERGNTQEYTLRFLSRAARAVLRNTGGLCDGDADKKAQFHRAARGGIFKGKYSPGAAGVGWSLAAN